MSTRQAIDVLLQSEPALSIKANYESAQTLFHRYGYPLIALVRRDLKQRYGATVLGFGWAAMQPLVQILLYVFVFAVLLQVKVRPGSNSADFALYLMSGMLPYMALAEGVQRAGSALRENRGLLDKVIFPAEILPAIGVVSAALIEIIGLILVASLASFFHVPLSSWLLLLPLMVLLRILLTLGFAWFVSVLTVFIGDFSQFQSLMLTVWMFLTPIFYSNDALNTLPGGVAWVLRCNPLYHIIVAYRAVLLESANPFPALAIATTWALGIGAAGLWFFRKTLDRAKDFL
jgi:lipopolysaccharide transport system permease protein